MPFPEDPGGPSNLLPISYFGNYGLYDICRLSALHARAETSRTWPNRKESLVSRVLSYRPNGQLSVASLQLQPLQQPGIRHRSFSFLFPARLVCLPSHLTPQSNRPYKYTTTKPVSSVIGGTRISCSASLLWLYRAKIVLSILLLYFAPWRSTKPHWGFRGVGATRRSGMMAIRLSAAMPPWGCWSKYVPDICFRVCPVLEQGRCEYLSLLVVSLQPPLFDHRPHIPIQVCRALLPRILF